MKRHTLSLLLINSVFLEVHLVAAGVLKNKTNRDNRDDRMDKPILRKLKLWFDPNDGKSQDKFPMGDFQAKVRFGPGVKKNRYDNGDTSTWNRFEEYPTALIDGKKDPGEWVNSPTSDLMTCDASVWVEIYLKGHFNIKNVVVYHYWADGRRYCGQKVMVWNEPNDAWTTLSPNYGTEWGPKETENGVTFTSTSNNWSKKVRVYSGRSNKNTGVHFIEVEIWHETVFCDSDSDCEDNGYGSSCGRPEYGSNAQPICCPSGKDMLCAAHWYCTDIPKGACCMCDDQCTDDKFCAIDYEGTSGCGNYGYCKPKFKKGETCHYNPECESGDCDGNWLGFCPCKCV